MIKINLLPLKEKKKRKEFLVIFLVAVVFVVISLTMFWIYIQRVKVRSDLKKEISQIEEESKGYQEKINEIKDLQAKEESLKTFKKTINSISETQRKVIVAIDQLALDLPDGIWLTSLTQGKGGDANKFVVQGYSFNRLALQDFTQTLQKPNGLLSAPAVSLMSISAAVGRNQQINQFAVTVTVADQGS